MPREIDEDELIEHWTLIGDELGQVAGKRGPTRLGFALLLKFYTRHGRFPRGRGELPDAAVDYVARQVGVAAPELAFYEWDGRTVEYHRAQVRKFLGFRECTVDDAEKLAVWLAEEVCQRERRVERVREELLTHCRDEGIEQPAAGRIGRIIGSGLRQAEKTLVARIAGRIPADAAARMSALVAEAHDDEETAGEDGRALFAQIRTDPGNISLNTTREEIAKLTAIRAIGLPANVFADIAPKVLAGWRDRAAVEAPSHLRDDHSEETKLTLLAALLHCRGREITDTLVDLLIATVHKINARAERRVVDEFVADLKRVSGKENILFRITEAAVGDPDGVVRDVVFPAAGGVGTLMDLLAEYKTKGNAFRQHKQRVFKASYTNHYRAGLIELIDALEFRSHNTVHRPVLDALELIKRYRVETTHATQYYARGEHVPVDGVIPADLAELLHRADKRGRQRVQRTVYECGVFQTLRERLRCKEIWVVGAEKWRNPDEDLPADFEAKRTENYAALRKPTSADAFVDEVREELRAELAALHDALPRLDWLDVKAGRKQGAIVLTPYDAAPEPRNLRRLKQAVRARWGVVPLLDMLTETALRTGCLAAFTPVGTRGDLDPEVLAERLLLLIYAYGTNTGVRAVAAGDHAHSEDDLRYTRRRYMTVPACRELARAIANATFAARQSWLWGEGTTAVASDSTHFTAYDQNIFTEWHSRYRRGKRGVLIYWTVEAKGSMAVHSQLLSCSASEVHAMVEGAMRHGTDMTIEANHVDSHGASFIGFGITRLLGFDLIARFKQINQMKLYLPDKGTGEAYPLLEPALTRPVRWDLIGQQYDPMIKYATAIRLGTASTEAILRRFTRDVTHPAYAAMLELGRAQRTIFLARWLRDRDLQRETTAALNVVENYNGVNDYIHFGKSGELASNRREEQELSMLCLQILQSSLGFVNTLMLQDILAEAEWADVLGDADRRGLTPLFTSNMNPYGEIQLDTSRRLALGDITDQQPAEPAAE
ncbi:MAG TPA: Tn3 family transposase [Amycolatopsis sp.]|uniref:Tn3 family transposase n=1 Tax=Amycolatopsis sp. TaxID=37632 RepID=UPI002B47079C|nr:Tn3 family transposase [Amycolatopsis sp.]HKS44984.1 Tn3 family transposase [Amycolatopsis sp.]